LPRGTSSVSAAAEAASSEPEFEPRAPLGSSLHAVAERAQAPASAPRESSDDLGAGSPSSAPTAGAAPASAGYASFEEDDATVVASVGFAAALSRSMDDAAPPGSMLVAAETDAEWYVGVGGSPEGPLTVPQLKERITSGGVDLTTLVWRDGFDDWCPLSQFPELAAIVEEFRPSKPVSPAFADGDDLGFAAVGFGQPRLGTLPQDNVPAPITGSEGIVTETRGSEVPAGVPRRHGSPIWAWVAVAAALGLGVSIGVAFFGGKKATVIKYVEVPVEGSAPLPDARPQPEKIAETEVPGDTKAVAGDGKIQQKPAGGSPAPGPPKTGGLDFGSSSGGPQGPTAGPGTKAGSGSAGGSQLDSAQVQRVVSGHTGSVKRSCWQPALSTRDRDAPSSARVSVTIHVSASGSVSSVSTSGDPKGYRGLSGCIASRVRGWQFPAAGGPTTVNVPFVFAAQ